ncbi:MAG: hypothetical protein HKN04_00190 [Rhodothermaceae bacterium]|nr:hypothetical protein [Rhodothermaceae bacterium]
MSERTTYEGWISVFNFGTDFEADLVRDRLDESGIPAVVLTQRDHAFNLNVGDMSPVHVMVPPDHVAAARDLIESAPLTDAELEEAAMSADLYAEDAHDPRTEAALDSGIEDISLDVPDEDDEEE